MIILEKKSQNHLYLRGTKFAYTIIISNARKSRKFVRKLIFRENVSETVFLFAGGFLLIVFFVLATCQLGIALILRGEIAN